MATDSEGNLVPALCEKWEVSPDGTSVFFTLRENARFANGQTLTAELFKRCFERSVRVARDLPPGLAAIRGASEFAKASDGELPGILVHSDHKLEIQLSEPLSIYPALLTDYKTGNYIRHGRRVPYRYGTVSHRFVQCGSNGSRSQRKLLERRNRFS